MTESAYDSAVEITAVLALWVGLSVWQRDRRAPAGVWFLGLTAAILCWCVGEVVSARAGLSPVVRERLIFLGILAVPPLWVAVAAHAAGLSLARRVRWFPVPLLVPSVALYALLYMGPWSGLFLSGGGRGVEEGPLFPLWTLWAYALTLTGVGLFVLAAVRWPRRGVWPRIALLAIGVLVPLLGNAAYLFWESGWARDPTPFLLCLAVIPLRGAVFGTGLFDVLPVDQRDVLRELPVGVVLADRTGRVLELNPAAAGLLHMAREEALGRSLEAVLSHAPGDAHVRRGAVQERGTRLHCAVICTPDCGRPRDAEPSVPPDAELGAPRPDEPAPALSPGAAG